MTNRSLGALFAVGLALIGAGATVSACTGIRIKPKDGSVIYARTLEFATDLRSELVVIPRGMAFTGTAPGGKPGRTWSAKYGIAGANAFGQPGVVDGLNEKGLAVGLFYFPGYAGYQAVSEADRERAVAPHELPAFLLSTCSDVGEAVTALQTAKVGAVLLDQLGFAPPAHYAVHDRSGRCVVIEYVGGELKIHDNPLGVMTNSPTFDWHVTNLRNYVNLSVTNVPPVALLGEKISAFGQGSGMLGLPGNFTPPSRFVRAVAFSNAALPVPTAREGVLQAFHILNQFDIPKGAARGVEHGHEVADYTLWTSAADLTNGRYYMTTYQSRRIQMLDLKKVDLDARAIRTIPLPADEVIEDVSAK